jgi:hypothetical protein
MISEVIEFEVNLMASGKIKQNFDINVKNPQGDTHLSMSQLLDEKFDLMIKTMENLMERMSMENNPSTKEKNKFQPKNQNFRRAPIPQIRQRDQRDQGD